MKALTVFLWLVVALYTQYVNAGTPLDPEILTFWTEVSIFHFLNWNILTFVAFLFTICIKLLPPILDTCYRHL